MTNPFKVLFAACLLTLGCSPLAPRQDYTKVFVLSALSDQANPPPLSATNSKVAIGIGPIDFRDYLRRPEVVTRATSNRIDVSPVDRWAEPLDKNFERVLAENLAMLLQTDRVERYPWARRTPIAYQIVISVERFETTADKEAQLKARWIIKNATTDKDLYAAETVATSHAVSNGESAAGALREDLATLSRAIASRIGALSERHGAVTLLLRHSRGGFLVQGNSNNREARKNSTLAGG